MQSGPYPIDLMVFYVQQTTRVTPKVTLALAKPPKPDAGCN